MSSSVHRGRNMTNPQKKPLGFYCYYEGVLSGRQCAPTPAGAQHRWPARAQSESACCLPLKLQLVVCCGNTERKWEMAHVRLKTHQRLVKLKKQKQVQPFWAMRFLPPGKWIYNGPKCTMRFWPCAWTETHEDTRMHVTHSSLWRVLRQWVAVLCRSTKDLWKRASFRGFGGLERQFHYSWLMPYVQTTQLCLFVSVSPPFSLSVFLSLLQQHTLCWSTLRGRSYRVFPSTPLWQPTMNNLAY